MGVTIPQPFVSSIEGPIGPVTVDGIPDTFHIDIDTLPKILLGVDPITLNPVSATITLNPVQVGLSIDKIPDIRAHLPADFSVGLSLLGTELLCVHLCGEAQVITEPYRPGPCENCAEARTPQGR
jgi:hypothetical protein